MSEVLQQNNAELLGAKCSVMAQVRRLKKDHENLFAKFKYTSVDDFKDHLRPLLAEHGLSIHMHQCKCELTLISTEKKKDAPYLTFDFECTIQHKSGQQAEPETITVILPFVGAQTTGQARSYALKEYMKTEFMASSGDSDDADQSEELTELSKQAARPLHGVLTQELREAVLIGPDAMLEWATSRKPSLDVMPKDWRTMLQVEYKEGLATRGMSVDEPSDKTISANESLDKEYAEAMKEN